MQCIVFFASNVLVQSLMGSWDWGGEEEARVTGWKGLN